MPYFYPGIGKVVLSCFPPEIAYGWVVYLAWARLSVRFPAQKKMKACNYETGVCLCIMRCFWQANREYQRNNRAQSTMVQTYYRWRGSTCRVSSKHSVSQQKVIPSLCDYGRTSGMASCSKTIRPPKKKCNHSFEAFGKAEEKPPIYDRIEIAELPVFKHTSLPMWRTSNSSGAWQLHCIREAEVGVSEAQEVQKWYRETAIQSQMAICNGILSGP